MSGTSKKDVLRQQIWAEARKASMWVFGMSRRGRIISSAIALLAVLGFALGHFIEDPILPVLAPIPLGLVLVFSLVQLTRISVDREQQRCTIGIAVLLGLGFSYKLSRVRLDTASAMALMGGAHHMLLLRVDVRSEDVTRPIELAKPTKFQILSTKNRAQADEMYARVSALLSPPPLPS